MEFKIISRFKQDISKMMIEFNNEELKQQIAEAVKKFANIDYTDGNIAEAKADRAKLRKFVQALEESRIAIKKAYMKPYEEFEAKIKELTSLVEVPINLIDGQVKEYETRLKDEKRISIETLYATTVGSLKELLPLSRIWNDKWLNASYKIKDIGVEIEQTIEKVKDDLAVIIDLGSEFELQLRDKYLSCLDLGETLREKNRLEEQKKRLSAYDMASQGHTEPEEMGAENVELITFAVRVTKAQKQALGKFILDNKIEIVRD